MLFDLGHIYNKSQVHVKSAPSPFPNCSPGTQTVESLKQTLRNKNNQVTREAIETLGNTKDPQAVNPLLRIVLNPNEKMETKIKAVEALGNIGDQRALEPLYEVLNEEYGETPEGKYNPVYQSTSKPKNGTKNSQYTKKWWKP
ncbi:MAG: HEAT repeat domain-containing protein [Candidatus Freyarchaeum deiterrae]